MRRQYTTAGTEEEDIIYTFYTTYIPKRWT